MKRLLNTLYIMSEDVYLTLDGENVVAKCGERITARYPLHTLQSIIDFSYMGASPALLGKCADMGVAFTFCSPRGRFLARVTGEANNAGKVECMHRMTAISCTGNGRSKR